jgi:hypothetical protein
MNDKLQAGQLLNDLLRDGEPPGFREALFEQTLEWAHRRKARRRMRRTAGTLISVCALIGLLLLLRFEPAVPPEAVVGSRPMPLIIHSRPLSPEMIVRTDLSSVERVNSSAHALTIIRSADARQLVQFITDDELLALLGPAPAVLVRVGPRESALVFAEPADEERFFSH